MSYIRERERERERVEFGVDYQMARFFFEEPNVKILQQRLSTSTINNATMYYVCMLYPLFINFLIQKTFHPLLI